MWYTWWGKGVDWLAIMGKNRETLRWEDELFGVTGFSLIWGNQSTIDATIFYPSNGVKWYSYLISFLLTPTTNIGALPLRVEMSKEPREWVYNRHENVILRHYITKMNPNLCIYPNKTT